MTDEGGVWRTISGRRVFIKDGQSLTDAMREIGKFGKEDAKPSEKRDAPSLDYGKTHRVWGKLGTSYTTQETDEYTLTGDQSGKVIKIPENDGEGAAVYKAPKCSGFKGGKYVGDDNKNAILSDGRIVLNDHDFNNDMYYKVREIVEAETLRLSGLTKEGEFFRGTDNKKELDYLKNGTIRASTNHMTGEKEDGVSVWETPKYPFKYQYRVSGEVVGVGSDGEPLLDPKSIKLIEAKSYGIADYNEAIEKGKSAFCKAYGWTDEQYDEAKDGYVKNKKRL